MVDRVLVLVPLAAIACGEVSRDPVDAAVATSDAASDRAADAVTADGGCDCSQPGSCPSQAEFEAAHCASAPGSDSHVTRVQSGSCPYLLVWWVGYNGGRQVFYGPGGSVVAQSWSNAELDIYGGCGQVPVCGGSEPTSCTVCAGSAVVDPPPLCNDE
jgi:hypothetical protein